MHERIKREMDEVKRSKHNVCIRRDQKKMKRKRETKRRKRERERKRKRLKPESFTEDGYGRVKLGKRNRGRKDSRMKERRSWNSKAYKKVCYLRWFFN